MVKGLAQIAYHTIFFLILLLVIVGLGFTVGITINRWTLLAAYALYGMGYIGFKIFQRERVSWRSIACLIILPLLFFATAELFGRTFDSSYDGQDYHQTAIISLADGWNPLKSSLPKILAPVGQYGLSGEFGMPFVQGYPKSLWIIQASVYRLTGFVNSGTMTNLLSALAALFIVFEVLVLLNINKVVAFAVSLLAVFEPPYIQEFLSFMSDGFSYEISLIAIASLIMVIRTRGGIKPLALFMCSLILLFGTKFSNLPVAGTLFLVCAGYLLHLRYKKAINLKALYQMLAAFSVAGLIVLSVPYGTNLLRSGTPFYPDNQSFAIGDLQVQNVPHNLQNKNRYYQLFFGIYSRAQTNAAAGSATEVGDVAQLKPPFTFSKQEVSQYGTFLDRVGYNGVLFSGLVTVSLIIFAWIFLMRKNRKDERLTYTVISVVVLIFIAALIDPTPNKLTYTPVVALLPICAVVALELLSKHTRATPVRILNTLLIVLIAANAVLVLIPVANARVNETQAVSSQLAEMANSGVTYQVNASDFYSNYARLSEYRVKFVKANKLTCSSPQVLVYTFNTTHYCPTT